MNREQAINWLKNAQKRQQEWQQEVKQRRAEHGPRKATSYAAENQTDKSPGIFF